MSITDDERKELQNLLQQAAQIELSTIPIYLYAMYSIKPRSGHNDASTDKAYNLLRSVAVEEMLHLSLVCNLIQATGGTVNLFDTYQKLNSDYFNGDYSASKGFYPFTMMHRWPNLCLSLGPCDEKLVFGTLLQIELPTSMEPPRPASGQPNEDEDKDEFETIGDFYKRIEDLINSCDDSDFQQAQQNNKQLPDQYPTYYQVAENATYFGPMSENSEEPNKPTSGQLNKIDSQQKASYAIRTIVFQGEGALGEYDDMLHKEKAHFFKFVDILDNYDDYLPRGSVWPLLENPAFQAWRDVPYCKDKTFASREWCLYIISLVFNDIFLYCLGLLNQAYGDQKYTSNDDDQTRTLNKVFLCMDRLLTPLASLLVQEPFADGSGNSGNYAPTFEPYGLWNWSQDWSNQLGAKAQDFVRELSEVLFAPEELWNKFANPEEAKRIVTQTFHVGLRLLDGDKEMEDFKIKNSDINNYLTTFSVDTYLNSFSRQDLDFETDILPLVTGRDIQAMQSESSLDLSQESSWKGSKTIYTALTTNTFGDQMPQNGPYFSDPELKLVAKFTSG